MKYQGIIFDLDGVICSTDEYHYQAWKALADRLGIPFGRERNNLLRGVSRLQSLEIILEKSVKRYTDAEKAAFAGSAEGAPHLTADLSGHADRTAVIILHHDALDKLAVVQTEQVLDRTVELGDLLADDLSGRDHELFFEGFP